MKFIIIVFEFYKRGIYLKIIVGYKLKCVNDVLCLIK